MPDVTVQKIPEHKRRGAVDAGQLWKIDHQMASGVPRTAAQIGEDGLPIIGDDGRPLERRMRRPKTEKWVSMSGHVVNARIADSTGDNREGVRAVQVRDRLHRSGAVRYGECPLRNQYSMQWLPGTMRKGEPCEVGSYGEKKACKHVEKLIADRTKMHNDRERKAERAAESIASKQLAENREQHTEMLKALTTAISSSRSGGRAG